jgi:2-methylisocitrate lyase-like PEP mutase family enzyme
MSASIFEAVGFHAIGTTSGGLNWSLGHLDGEEAPWSEVLAATARISSSVRVPVSADIEAGYARTQDEVGKNVADIIRAGAVGINIEDQLSGKLRPLAGVRQNPRGARVR